MYKNIGIAVARRPEKNCCVIVAGYYLGWDFLMRLIAHPELEKVLLEKFEELLINEKKEKSRENNKTK